MKRGRLNKKVNVQAMVSVNELLELIVDVSSHEEAKKIIEIIDLRFEDWGVTFEALEYFLSVCKSVCDLDVELKQQYLDLLKKYSFGG